jgi:hypothetical protein
MCPVLGTRSGNLCLGYTVINFFFPEFTPLNGTYGNNDVGLLCVLYFCLPR